MNIREYAVLGLINIASTRATADGRRGYWCTAQEIVDTLYDMDTWHDHFPDERRMFGPDVTAKDIGYILRRLNASWPIRGKKLVEKRRVRGLNQWQMTPEASSICIS